MDLGENQAMETTIDKIRYSFEKAVHTKPLKTFSYLSKKLHEIELPATALNM